MPRTPTATTTYYHVGKIPSLEIKNCTNPAPAACGQPKTPAKHPVYGRTLAYNLANFLRTLATPEEIERWSLTSLHERLIKTGARLVRHGRYAAFQMAEASLPRAVFAGLHDLIIGLRDPPAGALSA